MIQFKASFDDGCQLDLRTAELLAQYGVEDVTFYIPSQWTYVNRMHGDVPLSELELRRLASKYNIGSHTITHPMLTRISKGEAYKEIIESKQELEVLLNITIDDFCYPRGYANDYLRNIVSKYYKRARNTLVGNLGVSEDPVWETPTLHISGKRRKEYEGTTWQEEGDRLLEEAIKRDAAGETVIYHLWGHSWEVERYYDWGELEKFLQKISTVGKS
jgi:peptidoglycan/xylan/chitin deacetylase (PgdA/CDA1 family)